MANNLLTAQKISEKLPFMFADNMLIANTLTDHYSKDIGDGAGDSVKIRRSRFSSASGDGVDASSTENAQDEGSLEISANFDKHQRIPITEADLKYDIEDLQEQIFKPAMQKLGAEAEAFIHQYIFQNSIGMAGVAGTPATTADIISDASEYMDLYAIPADQRILCLNPTAKRRIIRDVSQTHSQAKFLPMSLAKGIVGDYDGFDTYKHHVYYTHTNGNYGGTPLVNGGTQAVEWSAVRDTYSQNIITDGWSAGATITKGTRINFANVNGLHPETKEDLGILQTFTVLADATADGAGNLTLSITPPIMLLSGSGTTKNYATVTQVPADNAAITVKSGDANTKHQTSLFYHPDAIAFASLPYAKSISSATDIAVKSLDGGKFPVFVELDRASNTAIDTAIIRVRFGIRLRDPRACGVLYV